MIMKLRFYLFFLIMLPVKGGITLVATELYLFSLCNHFSVQYAGIVVSLLAAQAYYSRFVFTLYTLTNDNQMTVYQPLCYPNRTYISLCRLVVRRFYCVDVFQNTVKNGGGLTLSFSTTGNKCR